MEGVLTSTMAPSATSRARGARALVGCVVALAGAHDVVLLLMLVLLRGWGRARTRHHKACTTGGPRHSSASRGLHQHRGWVLGGA